jgi:hypothetical protein
MMANFSKMEREVIVLKAIWELVDEMVNYEMFAKLPRTSDTNLTFKTMTHQRLFNILLVDLLSQPRKWPFELPMAPAGASKSRKNILYQLVIVCDDPKLNPSGGDLLRLPLEVFLRWLETECHVEKVWMPSISVEMNIRIKRFEFIKICGNIAKHSFPRLNAVVDEIREILEANGASVDEGQAYLVIPEFYEWFHDNVFSYHSSAIAEFLNNIRWGIFEYLTPEFARSFTGEDPSLPRYSYKIPAGCDKPLTQAIYWDLMNSVRSKPYLPRFEVTQYLKMRY